MERKAEEKAQGKATQAGELVQGVDDEVEEVVTDRIAQLDTAAEGLLDIEEGTPESLGVMVAKVVAVSSAVVLSWGYSALLL